MAEYNSLAGAPGDFTVGKGAPRSEATKGITVGGARRAADR